MLVLGILLLIFSFMVIAHPIFGSGIIVIMTGLAILCYGVSYIVFGLQLKKVKGAAGDIKKAVLSNFDNLKEEVLKAIQDAKDEKSGSEEVRKKLDSFKESLSE